MIFAVQSSRSGMTRLRKSGVDWATIAFPEAVGPARVSGRGRAMDDSALPESDGVPVRVMEPRHPRRAELGDVSGGLQGSLGVVDEGDAALLEFANHRRNVDHL